MKPRNKQLILDGLEQSIKELNETIQWRKSRPLVRFDRRFWLFLLIAVDLAFKAYVIYTLL